MTVDPEIQYERDIKRARRSLRASEAKLDDLMLAIDRYMATLRKKDAPDKKEIDDTIRVLTKTHLLIYEEMKKYGRHVLEQKGLIADAPLDLDAIRVEIGGKLDRLRTPERAG